MRTGYRIRIAILSLILIGNLTGCSAFENQPELSQNSNIEDDLALVKTEGKNDNTEIQEEEDEIKKYSSTEEINALNITENLLAFYLVLNNKKPFVSVDEGCQKFYWDEYFWHQGELELSFTISGFMLVDMDGDDEEELLLMGYMPETTQILDYQAGVVYSYQFIYRGMKGILPNGVYNSSSGYDVGGFYRIMYFDKGTYEEETLAYMEHDYYEVEGVEVSSEEFYAYTESYVNAEQVEDMDFTEEMLEEKLLGDLTEEEFSVIENIAPEEIIEEYIPYTAEELQVYLNVLTEEEEFICVTDDRQKLFLEDNYVRSKTEGDEYQVLYFSIVDMDEDEKPEIVLTCYPDTVLILHNTEEGVRGYRFSIYDEIRAITNDGIYSFDKYGVTGYERIISFGDSDCETEPVNDIESVILDRVRYYTFSEEKVEEIFKINNIREENVMYLNSMITDF